MSTSSSAMTLKTAGECIEHNILKDTPSFLWGPPGVGKSQLVKQIAKKLDQEKFGKVRSALRASAQKFLGRNQFGLIDIRLSLRDPVDMRGLPMIDPKTGTTRWLTPAELPQVERDGECGILFLDEANHASLAMQAVAMGLVLDRRAGEYILPDGWIPIAAGNRMIDRAAAQRTGTALDNRFAHYEVMPDLECWVEHANAVGTHPMFVACMRWKKGELLHRMPKDPNDHAFPTPRSITEAAKYADAPEGIRQSLFAALVGAGCAAEIEGFCQMWSRLPDMDQIVSDPKKAKLPDPNEPSVSYSVSTSLARIANRRNFENILTYAGRMQKEFEVLTVVDSVRRDESLMRTSAFITWATDNQDVTPSSWRQS